MINSFVPRVFKRAQPLWDLIVSAMGGFVFISGIRAAAIVEKESETPFIPSDSGSDGLY